MSFASIIPAGLCPVLLTYIGALTNKKGSEKELLSHALDSLQLKIEEWEDLSTPDDDSRNSSVDGRPEKGVGSPESNKQQPVMEKAGEKKDMLPPSKAEKAEPSAVILSQANSSSGRSASKTSQKSANAPTTVAATSRPMPSASASSTASNTESKTDLHPAMIADLIDTPILESTLGEKSPKRLADILILNAENFKKTILELHSDGGNLAEQNRYVFLSVWLYLRLKMLYAAFPAGDGSGQILLAALQVLFTQADNIAAELGPLGRSLASLSVTTSFDNYNHMSDGLQGLSTSYYAFLESVDNKVLGDVKKRFPDVVSLTYWSVLDRSPHKLDTPTDWTASILGEGYVLSRMLENLSEKGSVQPAAKPQASSFGSYTPIFTQINAEKILALLKRCTSNRSIFNLWGEIEKEKRDFVTQAIIEINTVDYLAAKDETLETVPDERGKQLRRVFKELKEKVPQDTLPGKLLVFVGAKPPTKLEGVLGALEVMLHQVVGFRERTAPKL